MALYAKENNFLEKAERQDFGDNNEYGAVLMHEGRIFYKHDKFDHVYVDRQLPWIPTA